MYCSHYMADQCAFNFLFHYCRHFLLQGNQCTCILRSSRCCLVAIWHLYSCLVLYYCCFFPHTTPPYCFHSNAITEMTVFSCCYHSSLSSVHIWRLSSSRERCSLQQIANCGAGSVGVCAYYMVQVWEQPYYVTRSGTMDKSLQNVDVKNLYFYKCVLR